MRKRREERITVRKYGLSASEGNLSYRISIVILYGNHSTPLIIRIVDGTYFGRGDGAAERDNGGDRAPFSLDVDIVDRFSLRESWWAGEVSGVLA
jgi:hypothetical protein